MVKNRQVIDILFADYEEKLYCPWEGLLKVASGRTNTWTGTLYRQEVIKSVGLDKSLAEGPAEQDFLLRVAAIFPYVIIKSPGAIFVVHESAVSASRREVDFMDEHMQMLNKIKRDEKIPVAIRNIICQKIQTITVNSLWLGGWMDIKQRNFSRAKRIARSLKDDFGENFKAVVLDYGIRLCEHSHIFYYCFIGLNQIRKFMHFARGAKECRLQAEYGAYLQYLEGPKQAS